MTRAKAKTDNQPDPDAHLSDHQWRMKMAAEGKALYVSGRDTDALIAAETDRRTLLQPRMVELTTEEWSGIDTAIPDIIELLNDVRNGFWDLSYTEDLDQPGVNSIMRLAARAVQSMENKEIHVLGRLDTAVRSSRAEALK